jgi:hypothetical protein
MNSFYRGAHRAKATSEKEAERTIASWAKRLLAICDKKIVNFVLQSTNLQVRLFLSLLFINRSGTEVLSAPVVLSADGPRRLAFVVAGHA